MNRSPEFSSDLPKLVTALYDIIHLFGHRSGGHHKLNINFAKTLLRLLAQPSFRQSLYYIQINMAGLKELSSLLPGNSQLKSAGPVDISIFTGVNPVCPFSH